MTCSEKIDHPLINLVKDTKGKVALGLQFALLFLETSHHIQYICIPIPGRWAKRSGPNM